MTKILILDVECAPKQAYVWRFFKENIGAKQVRGHGYLMSYAAKWLGSGNTFYSETRTEDDRYLCESLSALMDSADIIVAHNAERFDIPLIKGRMLVHGLMPPSPFKVLDTLRIAKREFLFPSNSLEYLAKVLGCQEKKTHKNFPGFELWTECMKGNPKAWQEMKEYNIQDVDTLEEIYLKMRPWYRQHPNVAVHMEDDKSRCPKCNSTHLHRRGFAYTNVGKYQKQQCQDCGGWSRTRFTVYDKDKRKELLVNAV